MEDAEIEEILDGVHPNLRQDAREVLTADYSGDFEEKLGLESEYAVVDSGFNPATAQGRDRAVKPLSYAEKEVGAAMAELVTDPVSVGSLDQLYRELRTKEEGVVEALAREGLWAVRTGVHPTVEIGNVPLSEGDRYRELIDYFDSRNDRVKAFGDEPVRPEGADVVGGICATHLNIAAGSMEDAVEKANYLSMIQPWAVAMSGNSRIVEANDTGYNSPRMDPMWEANFNGVDNPQRKDQSGTMDGYLEDIGDYLQRLTAIFPAENKVDEGVSEYWKDQRIKFYTGEEDEKNTEKGIVVEARLGDVQPSAEEEVAYNGFLRGRLAYAQATGEELLPVDKRRENRKAATRDGLDAEMWYWGEESDGYRLVSGAPRKMNHAEIEKARQGLEELGIDESGYLDVLGERLEYGTPSENQAAEYRQKRREMPVEQALAESLPVLSPPVRGFRPGATPDINLAQEE